MFRQKLQLQMFGYLGTKSVKVLIRHNNHGQFLKLCEGSLCLVRFRHKMHSHS